MATTRPQRPKLKQFIVLAKWRVVCLMLITAAVGMALTPANLWHPQSMIFGILGIALCAAASGALNQIFEQTIDATMTRTRNRPLVTNHLTIHQAYAIAISLLAIGSLMLAMTTNALTVALTLMTMLGYSVIYTKLLKPTTSQNIVIGGLFGAMPPLLGWCAITNSLHSFPLVLVAIIFSWTPSHFWALSLAKIDDYAKTTLPMLPITHGVRATQIHILGYGFILFLVTQLPYLIHATGPLYLIVVNLLNLWYLHSLVALYFNPRSKNCLIAFKRSNIYLLLLFSTLLLDHWL